MSVERELSGVLSNELARAVRTGRLPAGAVSVLADVLESVDPTASVGDVVASLTGIVPSELGEADLPAQQVPARNGRDRDLRWQLADRPGLDSSAREEIDRTAFLDDVSRASATSLDSAELLTQVCAVVQAHRLADVTRVWRSTDDGLRCATSSRDVRPDLAAQQAMITRRSVRTGSSGLSVPLLAGRHALGVLELERSTRDFTAEDVSLAHAVAGRTALGLRNAYEYEREHQLAERLQHAMLPTLVQLDELDLAARYRSSTSGVHIGGDWYDAFSRADGTVVLTVGDVTGHGFDAAAVMGQLQNALRAYEMEGHGPAASLRLVHELLRESRGSLYATAVVVEVELRSGMIRWANAGHPPPLVQNGSGEVWYLDADHGPMLGIDLSPSIPEHRRTLTPDSSVALYTDGLIERRTSDLDAGMARLAGAFQRCAAGKVGERTDDVLHEMLGGTDHDDDVCLLLCRWVGTDVHP